MAGSVTPGSSAAGSDYLLEHRYTHDEGRVFLSGSQALARLPLEQLRVDRSNGWNTAAYVTGYPGSPLAGYDKDVRAVVRLADDAGLRLVFQPGLNEELAATAVMGSQLSTTLTSTRHEGVIGIWYGKGPGLDRASDAIRHAVFAGTSARGGAVALVGDDPAAKSSTIPSSSDATLVDLHIPVLYPGDVQEALDLGRHAIALSRACGLWTSIKVVEAVADGTGSVELHPERIRPVVPTMEVDGKVFVPHPSGKLLTPYTLELEREFHEVRLELARRYGVENHLNTIAVRGPHDWIGVVATGHTYRETMEALRLLGLAGADDLRHAGVRLLRLGLPVPLDPALVRQFAAGLTEIVVVEEKNPTLEWFVKDALYSQNERPVVTGKHAPDGTRLLPGTGTLTADTIAPRLRSRLAQRLGPDRMAPEPPAPVPTRELIPLTVNRTPYFCSGCPHNTSTKVPDGVLVGGGIGCHSMVMFMEPDRVGDVVGLTAMGNEGAQWFGIAPFVTDHHLIQNIGDGTLFHSGMLAVRAAVANGVDITYKVLYNGAVAMTGGQDPFGQLDVPSLGTVFLAEGVARVLITTDDVARYRHVELPAGVEVWDRARIIEAQEVLARVPGTTVLVHDQRCAAELRRDRKRGLAETKPFRVVIDERVCEGCGDCGDQSNCLSVQPHDTEFGRKTRIDQASCNLDASCLRGDCPSFLTVVPATGRRAKRPDPATIATAPLPDPIVVVPTDECTIRMSGIGGTGVVTVSQVLGTAAMLDGYHVRGLDQTGLSQKAGPVVSDVRLSRRVAASVEPRHRGVGRRPARVRRARRGHRRAPRRVLRRPHGRRRVQRRDADRLDGHPPGAHVPVDAGERPPGGAQPLGVHDRRDRGHHRNPRRSRHGEHLPARRRRPTRPRAGAAGEHRAGDRAQRCRRRREPRRVPPRPHGVRGAGRRTWRPARARRPAVPRSGRAPPATTSSTTRARRTPAATARSSSVPSAPAPRPSHARSRSSSTG